MIAQTFGIHCSKRCEMLLAMTYSLYPEQLVAVAHRLANDQSLSAVRIARELHRLPAETAQRLTQATLEEAGIGLSKPHEFHLSSLGRVIGGKDDAV